jgi:tRNA pseudouridine55 synthase
MKRGESGLNGVLLVDKPAGMTSHDVVDAVRRMAGEKRIGHAGTLDPDATGLLVVMVGRATKLSDTLTAATKTYRATVAFGAATDTDDAQGTIIKESDTDPALFEPRCAREIVAELIGTSLQTPPSYSAIKIEGRRSYRAARNGDAPELSPREITVADAVLVSLDAQARTWTIELTVSKGTYIRAIARDLGERLGSCAHLSSLRRLACDELTVKDAYTLDFLDAHVIHPYDLARFFIESPIGGPSPIDAQVVIGSFDGLHRGHQKLIEGAVCEARVQGGEAVMVTFDRLPSTVLTPRGSSTQLCTSNQRDLIARSMGIDRVIALPFTPELAALTPEQFVARELMTRVIPAQVWVGSDFRFGADAHGTADDLASLGDGYGFETRILDLVVDGESEGGEKISSTTVREALAAGDVEKAMRLLGRPYTTSGTVMKSRGIGAAHGYPTANLTSSVSTRRSETASTVAPSPAKTASPTRPRYSSASPRMRPMGVACLKRIFWTTPAS